MTSVAVVVEARSFAKGGKLHESLDKIIDAADPTKYSIVFDIDETLLFPDKRLKRQRLNTPLVRLYRKVIKAGFQVFLVTARPDTGDNTLLTLKELKRDGIDLYTGLYMLPHGRSRSAKSVGTFKHETRLAIAKRTKRKILLTVGDQWTDVMPVHSKRSIESLDQKYGKKMFLLIKKPSTGVEWGLKLPDLWEEE